MRTEAAKIDETDRAIINAMQGGLPLIDQPFLDVANRLGISETELLARLQSMLDERVLTRFGPMFQVERMGGAFVLAAMTVPESRFEEVAAQVNSFPEVAHNYRREHAMNMWFVLATETPSGIADVIVQIEAVTDLPVFAFPKEQEYFVEMKLHA
jgi:siroheme decarboxylase